MRNAASPGCAILTHDFKGAARACLLMRPRSACVATMSWSKYLRCFPREPIRVTNNFIWTGSAVPAKPFATRFRRLSEPAWQERGGSRHIEFWSERSATDRRQAPLRPRQHIFLGNSAAASRLLAASSKRAPGANNVGPHSDTVSVRHPRKASAGHSIRTRMARLAARWGPCAASLPRARKSPAGHAGSMTAYPRRTNDYYSPRQSEHRFKHYCCCAKLLPVARMADKTEGSA